MLATEQTTPEFFLLAACHVSGLGGSLPETRVRGLPPGNHAGVSGCWPVTSTLVWGCGYSCDGTASGSLDQRFYSSQLGKFLAPDPYAATKSGNDSSRPQSWNRYAYVQNDPTNYRDPAGLYLCNPDSMDCLGDPCDVPELGARGAHPDDCGQGGGGGGGGAPPPPPTCGQTFFSTFGLMSGGEEDAVAVLLGENSWNFLGTHQYYAGQKYGSGTGSVIGVTDVSQEDDFMSDVLLNRVSQSGGSLSSWASNTAQFNGYSAGWAKFQADMSIAADTTQCSDLMVAFAALRSQEYGPELNTSILFWGAVVNPNTNRAISIPQGDFMIADTIFATSTPLVYPSR